MRRVALFLLLLTHGCTPSPSRTDSATSKTGSGGVGLNVLLVTIDTLRADHLGMYGYARRTSPHMDAFARAGTVFESAYTYWPKTRGSFAAMMSGKSASRNGYEQRRRLLHGFNETLADVLGKAQYATAAAVDNPNVGAAVGFAKGFDSFLETWENKTLATEMDRARAITAAGRRFLKAPPQGRPFFLWLHYVNPHAPYTPPPPYDALFLDERARSGPRLKKVEGFFGGIHSKWAVAGQDRLGYYVAQYDGEIAAVDEEVGKVFDVLRETGLRERTLVILASDHGESLGEHDYFFDHGADLFDPCLRIPLVIAIPGGPAGHRCHALVSTLDIFPTILDAVKVSYPPDLEGTSLLPLLRDKAVQRIRLYAENDRGHKGTHDLRFKLVATPAAAEAWQYGFYDRVNDPAETRDVARSRTDEFRSARERLRSYLERCEREWRRTRPLVEIQPTPPPVTDNVCERLLALGYVDHCP